MIEKNPRPVTDTVACLFDDVAELYGHGKEMIKKVIERSPVSEEAAKVVNFINEHAEGLFWASNAVHALLSPPAYVLGFASGLGWQTAYRLGLVDHNIQWIKTDSQKVEFSLVSLASIPFVGSTIRGLGSGFAMGSYIGSVRLKETHLDQIRHHIER